MFSRTRLMIPDSRGWSSGASVAGRGFQFRRGGVSLGAHDSIKLLGGTDAAPGTALCDKAEDTR